MKGFMEDEHRRRRQITRTEVILLGLVLFLLVKLYNPTVLPVVQHEKEDEHFYTCHAPQPKLLVENEIDHAAFDRDIEFASDLLQGVVEGTNGFGNPANSLTISIFTPNGPPIWEAGFGELRANETDSGPPDRNSIYRMASISKMFTTAQLMLQKQRGELDLDQDVSTILDDFHPSNKGWSGLDEKRVVTIRQLLTHTSGILRDDVLNVSWPGLPDNSANNTTPTRSPTRKNFMDRIRTIPAVMPAFTIPIYSNVAFNVAGYVAQEVGKLEFTKLLDQDIFQPLGMSSASFKKPARQDRVVVPQEPWSIWADWEMDDDNPAGGLWCSGADLARFGQELLVQGGSSGSSISLSSGGVFTKQTTNEWLKPFHAFDDGLLSTGLSWEIYTVPVGSRRMSLYTKGGTLPAFHTLFGIDPEREFGFSLLISGEPSGIDEIAIRIMRRFAKTLDKQRQMILRKKFAGLYQLDDSNSIQLEIADQGLAMTKAVINGQDLFKSMRLGEGDNGLVSLWPTGEPNAWRVAFGRPPAVPYTGCMFKFATVDPVYANGFPVDLFLFNGSNLLYPSVNQTFPRRDS